MRGFTLLELLLALAVISLAAALVAPYAGAGLDNVKARTAASKMATAFKYARAAAAHKTKKHCAQVAADAVTLTSEGKVLKEIRLPGDVFVKALKSERVCFYPAGGSSGGQFEVKSNKGKALYGVDVNPYTGLVKIARAKMAEKDGGQQSVFE